MSDTVHGHGHGGKAGETRRDFPTLASAALGAAGPRNTVRPLFDSMNPAKDVRALPSSEVDIKPTPVGQRVTVKWRGKPAFVDPRNGPAPTNLQVPGCAFLTPSTLRIG